MKGKLLLIDGHSLIFRMYYAFLRHPMINSKGEDVSILFGFTKYLLELVEKENPTHLAVCFDPPGKTFRHQLFPEYKGTRSATPELVIEALEPLIGICKALDIPVLMVPGFEGDDVLGSMAVRSASEGLDVYMVTPDKDFGQLVGKGIWQYKPGKGGSDSEILDSAALCAKLGIQSPSQVVDMLTICGDTSDNVPGVKGVGEVGASKLISKYGSVENIYAHLDELSPKQADMFREAADHIQLSKTLVTIKTDIPLETTADDMLLKEGHKAAVAELFDYYEFSSLKKYIHLAEGEVAKQAPSVKMEWVIVPAERLCDIAVQTGRCSIVLDADGEGIFAGIRNMTVAASDGSTNYAAEGKAENFSAMLSDSRVSKAGYGLKLTLGLLDNAGIRMEGRLEDVELMHYLVNPEITHKIEVLSRSYLSYNMEEEEDQPDTESDGFGLFDMIDSAEVKPKPRFKEAVVACLLAGILDSELKELAMDSLYSRIEEPLIRVLARMERDGVRVDMGILRESADKLAAEMGEIEEKVRKSVGIPELNVSSPKQVGIALFETLRIDPRVKPKRDARYTYPTDEETLLLYAEENPVIYDILEFRALKKLLGTYIEPFGGWISKRDGRIHTTFNQALTATGRLSSSKPNLQNIPVRTERGRELRRAFVAQDDNVIVSADYSQIELRLMAHFCGDENMREAFCRDRDVHSITASRIFGVPLEEVTADMRRMAKTANFGIMYGISAFGLAQRLHIPRVAAKKLIEDYFASFPAIQEWIAQTRQEASEKGYVQTLFGRRRYLPDINSRNANVRSLAERNAVNAPIQGTAADIIKIAMNSVDRRLREAGMKSRMVLQIHDELVFEAPSSELQELMEIIKYEMENVISLSVPLTVECNYGKNWLEAH